MRGRLLFVLAMAAFVPPALAADPPKTVPTKTVTVPVVPRPRPSLKDDARPAPDIPLDQTGVSLVVLDHDDGDRFAHEWLLSVFISGIARPGDGQCYREGAALVKLR